MQRTKIEWVKNQDGSQGYTINPVKGLCPVACKDNQGKEYCYARRMYKRFKWNPEMRFEEIVLTKALYQTSVGDKIFIGSTMELFGDWINPEWLQSIFDYIRTENDLNTHIFLTKQPQNLIKWNPYPRNCYIGVSVTNQNQYDDAIKYLREVDATVKFLSFEPLLEHINV